MVLGPTTSVILKVGHLGSLHDLQIVLAVEGIIMICVSLIGFVAISHEPGKSRWLCLAEKDMIVARLKSEHIGQATLLDSISKLKLVRGLLSPVTLIMSVMLLLTTITTNDLAGLQPSIANAAFPKRTQTIQQYLDMPVYMVGSLTPETIA